MISSSDITLFTLSEQHKPIKNTDHELWVTQKKKRKKKRFYWSQLHFWDVMFRNTKDVHLEVIILLSYCWSNHHCKTLQDKKSLSLLENVGPGTRNLKKRIKKEIFCLLVLVLYCKYRLNCHCVHQHYLHTWVSSSCHGDHHGCWTVSGPSAFFSTLLCWWKSDYSYVHLLLIISSNLTHYLTRWWGVVRRLWC